eukprot:COSAG03_NODE_5818_length_1167_cov_13.252809_3_plen_70_part_00
MGKGEVVSVGGTEWERGKCMSGRTEQLRVGIDHLDQIESSGRQGRDRGREADREAERQRGKQRGTETEA